MFGPLHTLPIPRSLVLKLQEFGFLYCEDVYPQSNEENPVLDTTAEELFKCYSSTPLEWWTALFTYIPTCSAFDLLQEECTVPRIATFCQKLDEYLDGGVPLKKVTEFSGAPGSGKTQICLQLCVDVQIPSAFGGLEGQAIFFDTCNGYSFSRLLEIAEACIDHCKKIAHKNQNSEMLNAIKTFCVKSVLENVIYSQCFSYFQLAASVTYLKEFLAKNKQVKLIVIDNITLPLQSVTNSLQRLRLLYELVGNLQEIASTFNIAVVLTNNMTTKIKSKSESTLVPALGESFTHCINYRFLLGYNSKDNNYVCVNLKNSSKLSSPIFFKVTKSGVRDALEIQ